MLESGWLDIMVHYDAVIMEEQDAFKKYFFNFHKEYIFTISVFY